MNRKNLPLLLMLTAGAVTCIITYIQKFTIFAKLASLFVVLLLFYIMGSVLVWILNHFDAQNEARLKEEGEVIEKDAEGGETGKPAAEAKDDKVEQE